MLSANARSQDKGKSGSQKNQDEFIILMLAFDFQSISWLPGFQIYSE
jgi:hypothetical protein